jgi:uncharacterized Zn finger protein
VRENAAAKGRRLLTEGRLIVEEVSNDLVSATCRGDSGAIYHVGHDENSWTCTCEAKGRCSHLVALMLVCVRERRKA